KLPSLATLMNTNSLRRAARRVLRQMTASARESADSQLAAIAHNLSDGQSEPGVGRRPETVDAVDAVGAEPEAARVARRLLLLGRDRELARLDRLIDGVPRRGDALVIRGEPGIGKSALLAYAAARAADRGMRVVTTTGVQPEVNLAFAGLHRLLLPFFDGMSQLPSLQRSALEAAFGQAGSEAPDIFLVGVASLGLIADAAANDPVLQVVDDVHWLDAPTAQVLAFVARRLELEPVVVLFALRDGMPVEADLAGLPELRVDPLDEDAARALLHESACDLPDGLQTRILREAAGNPLALVQLPPASARARGGP